MATTEEKIAVMQAFVEGKKIEASNGQNTRWCECVTPRWNWDMYEYRVKKEPRVFYIPAYKGFYIPAYKGMNPLGTPHTEEQYFKLHKEPYHKNTNWIKVVEVLD